MNTRLRECSRLRDDEKMFLQLSCKKLTIPQMSSIIKKKPETVRRFLKKNGLEYHWSFEIIINNKIITPMEFKVLEAIAKGHTNQQIMRSFCISRATMKTHEMHLKEKFNLKKENNDNENSAIRVKLALIYYKYFKNINIECEV